MKVYIQTVSSSSVTAPTLIVPPEAREDAIKALGLHKRYNRGLTGQDISRAKRMQANQPLTKEDLVDIWALFKHLEPFKRTREWVKGLADGSPPNPRIRWLSLGGDAAYFWLRGLKKAKVF